jgi:ABC-type phosphate transport system permease subunit
MKRTTAITLTLLTSLLCGIPSIVSCIFGIITVTGAQNPDFRRGFEDGSKGTSPDMILPIGLSLLALALILIVIPIAVSLISFRMSKANETPASSDLGK